MLIRKPIRRGHISTVPQLLAIFLTLVALTILTVYVSKGMNLGYISLFVAIAVATVKAGLVMLFFMHLAYDKPFNLMIFLSGFLFLGLFLFMALLDSNQYQPEIRRNRRHGRVVVAARWCRRPPAPARRNVNESSGVGRGTHDAARTW